MANQQGVTLTQVRQEAVRGKGGMLIATCGPVDFFGCFDGSGRLLVFDAKEGLAPNRLDTSDDHLREHQRLAILRYGERGAIAGVLALATASDQLFWLDWTLLRVRRPSVRWDEMQRLGSARMALDWGKVLAGCREAADRRAAERGLVVG